MSHHLWHVLEMCLHVWAWVLRPSREHVFGPSAACVFRSAVHSSESTKHLIKSFVFCFSPSEFKAGPRFRLWSRGCSCAMEKKRDCFPVRGGGAFWENRGSAYRSQPSKSFKGVLTSPLSKSFHLAQRVTSSRIGEYFTCVFPTAVVQPHCCRAVVRAVLRFMGNVQSRSP